MSDENDTLVDQDGVVHKKGWDGQYHPKKGLLGPERDTTWTDKPDVKRDWLGRPEEERDLLGRPVQSSSGESLYRRSGTRESGGGRSVSGAEGLLALILAAAVLAVASLGVIVVATPLIAPILLLVAGRARRRGDTTRFKKWQAWGTVSSAVGLLVVVVAAGAIGVGLFALVVTFLEDQAALALGNLSYVIAAAAGLGSSALSLVTGISPTAIVYLRQLETRLRASHRTAAACRVRAAYWMLGAIAAVTVLMTVVIATVLGVVAATESLAYQ